MALAKTYLTVNGKIRSEQRAGEAHSRDYVLDPLGSVIQIYQNGWPIADACYEPYGGIYTQWNMEGKTFTWLGGWGYRQTGVEWSSVYVRARHYSRGLSNWTSIDPLWPSEMAYGYVEGRVMTGVDYWGMQVGIIGGVAGSSTAVQIGAGQVGRGIPNGWRIDLGGKPNPSVGQGIRPWSGFEPAPFVLPPTNQSDYERECDRIEWSNLRRRKRYCFDRLYRLELQFCPGKTVKGIGGCSHKDEPWLLKYKAHLWCNCANIRFTMLDNCADLYIKDYGGANHKREAKIASDKCMECLFFAFGMGPHRFPLSQLPKPPRPLPLPPVPPSMQIT